MFTWVPRTKGIQKMKTAIVFLLFIFFTYSVCPMARRVRGDTSQDTLAHPFTLSDIRGDKVSFVRIDHYVEKLLSQKITVLVFWSTWEIDSINLLVKLQKYYDQFSEKGLSIIGVCSEQQKITEGKRETIIELIKDKKISFPILLDEDLKVFNLYKVIALPTTFLVTPDFKIRFKLTGIPLVGTQNLFSIIEDEYGGKKEKAKPLPNVYQPQKNAARYFNLALLEHSRDTYDPAKNHALKAAEIDSLYCDPLVLLARIYIDENNFSDAEIYLTKSEKLNPKLETLELLKLYLMIKRQNLNEAIPQLKKFVLAHPSDAEAVSYLAYAYGLKKDFDESLKLFEKAENISPDDYVIPALRSEILKLQGKEKEAQRELLKSIQLKRKGVKLD